jgi:hypothetical protein
VLLNSNSAIFQLYHDENKLIVNEMMTRFHTFSLHLYSTRSVKLQSLGTHVAHLRRRTDSLTQYSTAVSSLAEKLCTKPHAGSGLFYIQSILVMSNPCGPENLVRLNRKFEISGANLFSYYYWWAKHWIRDTRNFNLNVFEITRVDCIRKTGLGLLWLKALSTIFQLYHGSQFYWGTPRH